MLGDYKKALSYFRRASALYNKIGDRVSYAYTLWSMGTTYKMLGDYQNASGYFTLSQNLFKQTKDPRGLIYCTLGFGEIALLEGRKKLAEKYFRDSVNKAKKYGFKVERCHAERLSSCLSGKTTTACYHRLGLKLNFQTLPFNLP
jgi:tetratricopeptide (TPR) repeat protein